MEAFYSSVGRLYDSCVSEDYKATLARIAATRRIVDEILQQVEITALDPAVPVFGSLCEAWENQFACPSRFSTINQRRSHSTKLCWKGLWILPQPIKKSSGPTGAQ